MTVSDQLPTTLADALTLLHEARDTLRAIGAGEVDAFVMGNGGDPPNVFGLSTVDRPYRMFVENMRDGAATITAEGLILYANERLADLLSCPRETLVGAAFATICAGGLPWQWQGTGDGDRSAAPVELELIDASGELVPVLVGTSPLDVDGERLMCVTFTDLTAHRAQETEISNLHQAQLADGLRFTAVVEALQEGMLVQDGEGRVLEANRMASKILGKSLDQPLTDAPSRLWSDAQGPDGLPLAPEDLPSRHALALGRPVLRELVGVDRQGDRVWLEINSVPLRLPGQPEPVVISSFRDVSARVAAEEEIRFQALLLDTAGQAIIAVDDQGVAVYWNKHAEQMYGWTADEAVGRFVIDLITPTPVAGLHEEIAAEMSAGQTWRSDQWVTRRDGTVFPVFATVTPVLDDDGGLHAMISVATDITDRMEAEEQARRLSAIVESSSDAIVGMTLDRVITNWNPGAVALFGYEADEAMGQDIAMLAAPTVREHVLTGLRDAEDMSLTNVETQCITKQRSLVNVSLSISPILDEHGQAVGLSGIARNVADRIALQHLADESQKKFVVAYHEGQLDAIGRDEANRASRAKTEFLSRMSHELRTPLNAMLGFGQILSMDDLTPDQRESVGFICRAGEHLLDLINDVLDISRIEAGALKLSLEPVHLNEVIANAVALIRPQAAQEGISLRDGIAKDDVYVQSDRQRLLQVMLNLLSNAVKYNRPDGRIELSCTSSGGRVAIAVTDTGIGISGANLEKLFAPFERLGADRTGVEGTGVGLALSRVLSQEMGGSLTVTSSVGTGSTFTLELPAGAPSEPVESEDPTPAPVAVTTSTGPVSVLAIEDDVANIRLLERIMQECDNATLLTAIQGRLGLELAGQHHPDLILLDLGLPDLSGEAVLQQLQADPATAAIPVVICSGDAAGDQRRACLDAGAAGYLTKPFALDELYEIIELARSGQPVVQVDRSGGLGGSNS